MQVPCRCCEEHCSRRPGQALCTPPHPRSGGARLDGSDSALRLDVPAGQGLFEPRRDLVVFNVAIRAYLGVRGGVRFIRYPP